MASSSKKEEFLDRDEVLDEGYEELTEDWLSEREMDEPPQDLLAAVRRIIQLLEIDYSAAKQYLEEFPDANEIKKRLRQGSEICQAWLQVLRPGNKESLSPSVLAAARFDFAQHVMYLRKVNCRFIEIQTRKGYDEL